jgi:predicted transposase YdaD
MFLQVAQRKKGRIQFFWLSYFVDSQTWLNLMKITTVLHDKTIKKKEKLMGPELEEN